MRARCATGSASGWRRAGGAVTLVGSDAGVSFYSVHDPERGTTATVLANTTEGAWPVGDALERILGG